MQVSDFSHPTNVAASLSPRTPEANTRSSEGSQGASTHQGRTYRTITTEVPVSLARSILLIVKVVFLTLITLGLALFFPSFREDWKTALKGSETKLEQVSVFETPPYEVRQDNLHMPTAGEDKYLYRQRIFQQTKEAYEKGYLLKGKFVGIDNQPMLEGTEVYEQMPPLPPVDTSFMTSFQVITEDTFNVLIKLRELGSNPVGINMANAYKRGGGVEDGCPAQEEALSRRSNYMAIENHPAAGKARLFEGGIYSPHVQVFREDDDAYFAFMEEPIDVALIAVAAFDLRRSSQDRIRLGLPAEGKFTDQQLRYHMGFVNRTKERIRNMLRKAAERGHKDLVLGALGCGAFLNPPKLVASLFEQVFGEREFKGRFEKVIFAILEQRPQDAENVAAFTEMCERLKQPS